MFECLENRLMLSITPGGGVHASIPVKPTGLTGTAIGTAITLHWKDNSSNETGFAVQRLAPGATNFVTVAKVSAGATTFTDAKAPVGADTYVIRAFNSAGQSDASNSTMIITVLAPTKVKAVAISSTEVNLNWSGDLGASAGYTVQRAISAIGPWTTVGNTAAGVRTFSDSGLAGATKYVYRVVAHGLGTATSTSPLVSVTTLASIARSPVNQPTVGAIIPHWHHRR